MKRVYRYEMEVRVDDNDVAELGNAIARTTALFFKKDPDWEAPDNIQWLEVSGITIPYDPDKTINTRDMNIGDPDVRRELREKREKQVLEAMRRNEF